MASPSVPPPVPAWQQITSGFLAWCRREPLGAALLAGIVGTLVYFYGFLPLFLGGKVTVAFWAWDAWKPDLNQEHSKLVVPIFLGLIYWHRGKLAAACGRGSAWGLACVMAGIVFYLLGARMIEARYAIVSFPFIIFGSVWFLFGWKAARVILFPCAFFVFAVPMGAVEQATHKLQFLITGMVSFLSNLIGIRVIPDGTTLRAGDNSFNFEIAEGCSGVRSIIAMAMLTSVYAHLTQKELWKKVVIFLASGLFAVVGNIGRIFSIILFAKFINKDLAGSLYHDYSAFIFFPIALAAMVGFSNLLNPKRVAKGAGIRTGQQPKRKDPVSYDY